MCKVVDEWNVTGKGDYVLTLNEATPLKPYNKYRIGGELYTPMSISGSPMWIAVKGKGGFVGKEVEFVSA